MNRHVGPETVLTPSLTVAYHSYCDSAVSPGHDIVASEPEETMVLPIN